MNLLFFDCETTGVPKNYQASYEDVDNWPRVISLAWILTSPDGTVITGPSPGKAQRMANAH